jgi:hypothetical protein
MKIAVLLRGQPRFSNHGAEFFRKFVVDRFPEHEFKIFIGTWKTISNVMEKPINPSTPIYGREYDQTMLSLEQAIDLIKNWKPAGFHITAEKELFSLIKKTYTALIMNTEKYDALRLLLDDPTEPNGKNLLVPGHLDVMFESPEYLIENLIWGNKIELSDEMYTLKRSLINNQYLFGQIYSLGKSYMMFEHYCEKEDYKPDLVWSSRMDMIHWYNNANVFEKIKKNLEIAEDIHKCSVVNVDKIEIHGGKPWASDYNFYMLPGAATNLLSDIDYKFKKWILEDTRALMSVIGSGPSLQHVMWTSFFRDCNMIALNPFLTPAHSEVIRPKENLETIVKKTLESETTLKTVNQFVIDTVITYPYPNANTPVPKEVVDKYYDLLSNN